MVRYSKKYGDITNNIFTWGAEAVLGFIFQKAQKYVSRYENRTAFYDEMQTMSDNRATRRQMSKMVHRLKTSGYIEIDETNGRSVRLTDKAKIKIVEAVAEKTRLDDRNRFVSFDIPESLHMNRDQFRKVIKRIGFRQIQQSLWVINKNVGELVEITAKEYGVEEYVAYIVSENSNIETFIKRTLKSK